MKQHLLKTWLMLLCLLTGVGTTWAEDFTLTSANQVVQNGITVSFSKTGSGTAPTWYAAGLRLYPGCTVTISSESNITEISFNWEKQGSKTFATDVTANVGTYNHPSAAGTGTWSGSAKSVTFTVNGSSVQLQLNTFSVTTSGGGDTPTDPVDASWSVEPASVSVKATKTEKATVTTNYDGSLSVSSANSEVATATISGKVITVTGVAVGNTSLTVTGAATSAYNAISKTINVAVTANVRPENEIFYESFDTNEGTGGNDNQWSGSIASSDIKQDNDGWTFVSAKGANKCAKFGTGSALGSATTPALGQACNATLTFKAAAWNGGSESTTLKLSVVGDGTVSPATVTMTKGAWTDFEVTLTNLTVDSKVKFEGNAASNSRFFLDEVSIVKTSAPDPDPEPTTYNVTIAEGIENGTVTANLTSAEEGATITLTATPADGYEFDAWDVKDASDNAITVTDNKFNMPAADVTVSATFKAVGGQPLTVTFGNLGYESWGKSALFSGSTYDELTQTVSNVVFDYTRGSGSTYANTTSIRFYKDNKLTFTAPDGYKIVSIVWTGSGFKEDVTTNVQTCTSSTSALSWTGAASSVTFTRPSDAASYATLSKVVVTLEEGSVPPTDPVIPNFIKTATHDLEVNATPYDVRKLLNIPSDYPEGTEGAYNITTTIDGLTEKDGEFNCVYPWLSFQKTGTYTVTVTAAAIPGKYAETTGTIAVTVKEPVITTFASLEELVAADLASGTEVTVSFENVPIKSFQTVSGTRKGVYFDIQKADKDIEIYFNSAVPAEWVAGGMLTGSMTCPWKLYNGTWELAPASGWAWTNLTYEAPTVTLVSVAVSGTPEKTEYYDGDAFQTAGLVVTGTYSDGTNAPITEGITWAVTPETLTEGTTSVNVTATVEDKTSPAYTVNGLTVLADSYKTATYEFSSFTSGATVELTDLDGFVITLAKNNGSTSPAWSSNQARVYAKGSLTIKSDYAIIKSIEYDYVMNAGGKDKVVPTIEGVAGTTDAGSWDVANKTWTGSDSEVTFSTSGTAGNIGFTKLIIRYEENKVITLVAQDEEEAYFATFSCDQNVEFPAATTTVYTVDATADGIAMHEVTSKQVPANTGVLIKCTTNNAPYKKVAAAEALTNNMLYPASKAKEELDGCKFYMLAYASSEKDKLGFYWGAADGAAFTSREGSAYLAVPASMAPVKGFSFSDMETGIEKVNESSLENGEVYNLQGQRVNANAKGIIIKNGKKYFVK